LTFSTSTGQISGTPTAVLATTSFTVTVTDQTTPVAQTSSKNFSLTVTVPPVTAASSSATAVSGVTTTVDLTVGATGGPFTSAQLISLTPPGAGTAVITAAAGRFLLNFTPGPTFAGTAVVTFTLSSAVATSAPATVTFSVVPRPDPSKDPEVIGLVNAQAQSAQHFASTQITNFNDRLESLHDGSCYKDSFHLGLSDSRNTADNDPLQRLGIGVKPNSASNGTGLFGTASNDRGPGNVWGPESATVANSYASVGGDGSGRASRREAAAKKSHEAADKKPDGCDDADKSFAAWTSGFVNYGRLSTGTNSTIDYLTAGVSAGVDHRFSPSFIAGFGVGYGNDKSTIGSNGTVSTAFSYDVALYGSWHPSQFTFVDALVGYGIMSFDSNRFITGSSGDFAAGRRNGHQVFGSLTSGYEYRSGGFLFSPYGRLRASWSVLDAFTETGGGVFALQYGTESISSFTAGLGLRTSYEFREPWGAVTPRMRIEYAHEFAGGSSASLAYADQFGLGGSIYTLPITPTGSDYVVTGIGTDIRFMCDWILGLDYRTSFGQEKTAPQLIQIKLGTKF
jgi:uncharacterized protein YhjY with autotransporter beta-barrel domain